MGRLLSDIIIGTDLLDDASQIFFQSDYSSSEDGEVATTLCISLHARAKSPAGEKKCISYIPQRNSTTTPKIFFLFSPYYFFEEWTYLYLS